LAGDSDQERKKNDWKKPSLRQSDMGKGENKVKKCSLLVSLSVTGV
jgi:hypothetical protein